MYEVTQTCQNLTNAACLPQNGGEAPLLFTENETNAERLFGSKNNTPYVKDAFHRYIVNGENA